MWGGWEYFLEGGFDVLAKVPPLKFSGLIRPSEKLYLSLWSRTCVVSEPRVTV